MTDPTLKNIDQEVVKEEARKARWSVLNEFWHYFSANKGAVIGLCIVGFMILMAVLAL